jgi:hypothetical protein
MRDYWIEYQRRRWMKPNAAVWMRPDAARWLLPNQKIWMGPKNWEAKYSPDQPRVPAGNSDGGQWTSEATAQADFGSVTDAFGHPYYEPGGHHEMVRSIYGKWDLKPETRRVFDNSTTGTVPRMLLRTSPEGVPQGNTGA